MIFYLCPKCETRYSQIERREDKFCKLCGTFLKEQLEKEPFDDVWRRIVAYEGKEFRLKGGEIFTYNIKGSILRPSRTNWNIPKSDIVLAYEMIPIEGPGKINNIVMGPSYVWGILYDNRISAGMW